MPPRNGRCAALLAAAALGLAAVSARSEEQEGHRPRSSELLRQLNAEDAYEQQVAFVRLEALREPATLPAIKPYLEHRDPDTRSYAVRALGAIGGIAEVPTLLEVLRTDHHPRVRRAALLALEPIQQADPQILPAFLKALRDRKPEVRMTAADIVSRIDDPRAREAIRSRYKRERDRDVRRVLTEAIKRVGSP